MPTPTVCETENEEGVTAKPDDDDVDDSVDVAENKNDTAVKSDNDAADIVADNDGTLVAAAVGAAFIDAMDTCVAVPRPGMDAEDAAAVVAAASFKLSESKRPKKKRMCKFPGCSNTVKAQGHCQRHGAKTKRCKAAGCDNQAQGSHEGFCKRHWREYVAPEEKRKRKKIVQEPTTCPPVGFSVYDSILPASFGWKADGSGGGAKSPKKEFKREVMQGSMAELGNTVDIKKDVLKPSDEDQMDVIPILQHLLDYEHLDAGWHRANERLARGIRPPKSVSIQLESWEKQLAVMEMALVAGTDTRRVSSQRVTKVLAHAWGREKGFHKLMLDNHCRRRGDLDRKRRVDAGMTMSAGKKLAYKKKLEANRAAKAKRKRGEEAPTSQPQDPQDKLSVLHPEQTRNDDENFGELPAPGGAEIKAWQMEQIQIPPQPVEEMEVEVDEPPPIEEPSIEVEEAVLPENEAQV